MRGTGDSGQTEDQPVPEERGIRYESDKLMYISLEGLILGHIEGTFLIQIRV